MFNPFAQGGWPNAANPNAGSSGSGSSPQPSIFGALPYPSRNPTPMFMTFRFTQFSPTIMDSTVIANSRTYFRVKTDAPTVGYTVIYNSANQPTIVIEWLKHPVIEIRDILSKRQTSQWLELSADKTYRTMTARGKTFLWVPDGSHISLYSAGLGAPQIYARIAREEGAVALELTSEAIQIGLLEVAVAAALLFQCGRNID
ncbi:hypothetical protein DFH08DRAFT_691395 [Mycena albidolilacea]|uniref:Uncharacterized protein n=1 Tax=Mycena albidolilacea TaxID=1033008 RepID=A0AAD7ABX6_9AGAR|nr:hypothetical protein DFH08DRAFT_691395 [Mycena albidolilacea]